MKCCGSVRVLLAVVVCLAAWLLIGTQRAFVQEPAAEEPAAKESAAEQETETPKKTRRAPRGRLPNYYNKVVSETQRLKIYEIQASYRPKIDALMQQVEALKEEMKAEVEAVLTPEQLKLVEQARAAALEARLKRLEARKKALLEEEE